MLLAANADPNIRNKREEIYYEKIHQYQGYDHRRRSRFTKHWSPLDIAIRRKNKYVIQLLQAYGAIYDHHMHHYS